MEAELNLLEERVIALTALCQQIRDENRDLVTQLQTEKDQNRALSDKIVAAAERLEQLLFRLPEDA